jgi:hypothetical protein
MQVQLANRPMVSGPEEPNSRDPGTDTRLATSCRELKDNRGNAMAFDEINAPEARCRELDVTREGGRWAVRHGGGYLGPVTSEAEGWAIVQALSRPPAAGRPSRCGSLRRRTSRRPA